MPPQLVRKEISISSDAFDEMTGALQEAGIKLDNDSEFVVKKDLAIKGPILYRQVNLRHQIMMEVVKVYKSPITNDFEVSDVAHFIDFLDNVYNYCLTGVKPAKQETKTTATTKTTKATPLQNKTGGWGA